MNETASVVAGAYDFTMLTLTLWLVCKGVRGAFRALVGLFKK